MKSTKTNIQKDELECIIDRYKKGLAGYTETFFSVCTWIHRNKFSEQARKRLRECDFRRDEEKADE